MVAVRIGVRGGALALALLLVSPRGVAAASDAREAVLKFDPARTAIGFVLKGFPHNTHGTFKLRGGELRVHPGTGKTSGSIVVDAASAETGISMRDSEMHGSILEVQRYPDIVFEPQQAEGHPLVQGDFTVKVSGSLSMHGDRHHLNLEVLVHRTGDDFTATTHFAIPYVQWGMKNPSILFLTVSDQVELDVNAAGHVTWAPPAPSMGSGVPRPAPSAPRGN
jgi:polyisoprenoid-binding protein YceI